MEYEESSARGDVEQELPRGDVTEGVVRIGSTVRRPVQPQSGAVAHYLQPLESVGFRGAPRFLGRDRSGRDVVEYLEGEVAGDPPEPWAADEELLKSVGRLLSHNDVSSQSVVVRGGRAVGLIDFDLAGPTTRVEDFCNTATPWLPLRDPVDVWPGWPAWGQPARLRVLADAYGLTPDERASLVDVLLRRADRMWLSMQGAAEHLGGGWARMWSEGVGDLIQRRRAWLVANRDAFMTALRRPCPPRGEGRPA